MNKFPERLKALRVENNLTQTELAKQIGFTQTGIARWEAGERNPSIEMLIVLARFFKVSIDYLVGFVEY